MDINELKQRALALLARLSKDEQKKMMDEMTDEMKARPFAEYSDFADCVSKNSDKDNPEAYCGAIKREAEGESADTKRSAKTKRAFPFGLAQFDVKLQVRADTDLPKGVCGRITGVLLPYGRTDTYGTRFMKGCIDRSRAEKVPAGRVPLFINMTFDGSGMHMYNARTHIGVIRSLEDVGDDAMMVADVFDTVDGRAAKDYVAAVLGAGASTGLSVGFRERQPPELKQEEIDGHKQYVAEYREIELMEGTVTPLPAVPGADVLAVRSQTDLKEFTRGLLERLPVSERSALFEEFVQQRTDADAKPAGGAPPVAAEPKAGDAKDVATEATMEDRLTAFRSTFTMEKPQ
jgi:hypothetical protein